MQFEALKVFCDVARCRSFSQAAALNGLTQPAVSHIVAQLEERLRVQLIDRNTRPLQLTPLGQVYYEGCNACVEQYLELEARIRNAPSDLPATVQVAAIYSVGLGDMGLFVERFKQQANARVQVEYLHPDRVYEQVLGGTADFGLVSFPRRSRDLTVTPWRDEPMVLACAPDHPLAGKDAVTPADLAGRKYVAFERGLVIRREIDRFLHKLGVAVEVAAEFDNVETIKQAVAVGAGVALLPEPTFRREAEGGGLVARPLRGCSFVRPLAIIVRRHHHLGPAAQRFLDFLRDNGTAARPAAAPHADGRPRARTTSRTR